MKLALSLLFLISTSLLAQSNQAEPKSKHLEMVLIPFTDSDTFILKQAADNLEEAYKKVNEADEAIGLAHGFTEEEVKSSKVLIGSNNLIYFEEVEDTDEDPNQKIDPKISEEKGLDISGYIENPNVKNHCVISRNYMANCDIVGNVLKGDYNPETTNQ